MHMKKAYTFRFDATLIKKLDLFDGSRTYNVDLAIQNYVSDGFSKSYDSNTDIIQILKDHIVDLKNDKNLLQKRIDYYSLSWFQRLLLSKHTKS